MSAQQSSSVVRFDQSIRQIKPDEQKAPGHYELPQSPQGQRDYQIPSQAQVLDSVRQM